MEPIGQKFKDARKEKGLFIEQVSRETNISKKYIEAIEEERFGDFPGEAYITGFLRSYAGYLGLNVEEIITIYKNTKLQEQPVPQELFEPKPRFPMIPVAAGIAVLLAVSAGLIVFLNGRGLSGDGTKVVREKAPVSDTKGKSDGKEYEMTSSFIERRFAEGDTVVVRYRELPYRIIIEKTGEQVTLSLPTGSVDLAKGRELLADLDSDSSNDIRILVREIDAQGKGAVLKFDRNTEAPAVVSSGISSEEELSNVSAAAVAAVVSPAVPASTLTSRKQAEKVIFESENMLPFTINLTFRGYCLMRYESDGGRREERYFHKGDTFRLDVSKSIKIWLSNASSVSAAVNNIDYSFGSAGSVSAKIIRWSEKPGGGYAVKAFPLY